MAGAFLITVDTEGDNLWAKPRTVTTRNAGYLPRFQALCERHGLRPTYLTNWEMVQSPQFVEFARDVLTRGQGEIGMHLHAWNSPPIVPLTADDDRHAPYLIEFPRQQIVEKVRRMTGALEETFGVKMVSHRAGRWSLDETYAQVLVDHGYRVDCSVTPHVNWRFCKGDPARPGGTDYTDFTESSYFMNLADIRQPGDSPLLEVPMTIIQTRRDPAPLRALRRAVSPSFYATVLLRKIAPNHLWLMPNGRNGQRLFRVVNHCIAQGRPYIEMAIHSSELMPGGSPTFPTDESIEHLYESLESLFTAATPHYAGCTLSEYHQRITGDA